MKYFAFGKRKLYFCPSLSCPPFMKKQLLKLILLLLVSTVSAQVGINTTNPDAQLDIRSSNQATPLNTDGILIPKIDAFPVTNPTTAQNGMMVFLTTTIGTKLPGFYYWDNATTSWIGLASSPNYWALTGNSGTISGTNFIGTTDLQSLDVRTNNILRTRFTTKGQIETLNTGNSVFVGEGAGANDDLSDNRNVLIGLNAGQTSTTSNFNTGIGYQALQNSVSNGATAVGYKALQNYTGIRGTAVGYEALKLTTTGSSNTALGYAALSKNTTGGNNTAVGSEALLNVTTGNSNVGVGKYALLYTTTAAQNTGVGTSALFDNTTGTNNTALGFQSLVNNSSGNNNVALGINTLASNTTGSNNIGLGYGADVLSNALQNAIAIGLNAKVNASNSMVLGGTGVDAVKVGIGTTTPAKELEVVGEVRTSSLAGTGTRVVQADTNGTLTPLTAGTASQVLLGTGVWGSVPTNTAWSLTGNTGTVSGTNFIGTSDNQAIDFRTNNTIKTRLTTKGQIETLNTGQSVFIGEGAGANDDLSNNINVFVGYQAGNANSTGNDNAALGYRALQLTTTGSYNTATGSNALRSNTTGYDNTGNGNSALNANTTGGNNTAIGAHAMNSNTTGNSNTAIGRVAMNNNTTANNNTAVGARSLESTTTGSSNTAIGYRAAGTNTTGYDITAQGYGSLLNNTTGFGNTAIGTNALSVNTTGNNNMALGYNADVTTAALTNATAIGYNAKVNASNSMVLGGTGASAVKVGIGTTTPVETLEVVGNVRSSSLAGTGTRVVQADTNGTLTPLAAGTASQVLLGTGVWGSVPTNTAWSLTGNSGTTAGTNFMGTTDNQAIDFRTNNIIKTRFTTKGQIETLNTGQSVFVGEGAGANDDLSNNINVFVGYQAGNTNTTGNDNVGLGYRALQLTTTGSYNTAMGSNAMRSNTTGYDNIGVGNSALDVNTTGYNNAAVGANSLGSNTTGHNNSALGRTALYSNTTGYHNTSVGSLSLYNNTTGIGNTAMGRNTLASNTTGNNNTGVGYVSMDANTTGNNNTSIGFASLGSNTIGFNNTAIGYNSLLFNTDGNYNSALGDGSGYSNTSGIRNVFVGYFSGFSNTTGSGNVSAGPYSLETNTTGSNNIAIGNSADVTSAALTNATAIGYNAKVANSNSMVLGGTGADAVKVGIGTTTPAKELEVVGEVRTSSLAGTGNRMVQADVDGTLTPLAAGTASQVLLGTGVWGSVPGNDWSTSGNSGTFSGTDFIGTTDNQALDLRTNNIVRARFTTKGQIETLNTGNSVFIGENAGANDDLTTNQNTFIGYNSGNGNTAGTNNTAIGYNALRTATTSNNNTAVGSGSQTLSTGISNSSLGTSAMAANTTGFNNTAVGASAMATNTTGGSNAALGSGAMQYNVTGNANTAIGFAALNSANSSFNTALGYFALQTSTGTTNTAVGGFAIKSNTTGSNNTGIGYNVLGSNTTGIRNIALGENALGLNSTGSRNVGIGYQAGYSSLGGGNVFLGYQAGYSEAGANKLYIDNSNTANPLIYGDFSTDLLRVNGTLNVNNTYSFPTTDGAAGTVLTTNGAGTVTWAAPVDSNAWSKTGNSGTTAGTNFIGTTNAVDFVFKTNNTERMRVLSTGNVGIGTASPAAPLDVNGSAMLSSSGANSDLQFNTVSRSTIYPNGANTPANLAIQLRSKGTGTLELNSDNNGNVQMVTGGGNVGIGTATPTQAKMVVNGTQNNTLSYGFLNSAGSIGTVGGGTAGFSIYASGRIAATEFNAFSDERIKNIKGISNSSKDLETLNKIQITDYTFKDSIGKGNGMSKKVIAQQVEKVYPQAVSTITDVVPDIYTIAKIKDGRVILKNTLQKGDRVRLVFGDRTELVDVLQADEFGFNVAVKDEGKVFVFGREVKDFHTVDYEALSTLNISATQELLKMINQQEAQIRDLKADNADMNKRLSETESDINQIKSLLRIDADTADNTVKRQGKL